MHGTHRHDLSPPTPNNQPNQQETPSIKLQHRSERAGSRIHGRPPSTDAMTGSMQSQASCIPPHWRPLHPDSRILEDAACTPGFATYCTVRRGDLLQSRFRSQDTIHIHIACLLGFGSVTGCRKFVHCTSRTTRVGIFRDLR